MILSGLLIIRGKKSQISRDFWRQIRGEIGRFRGNFAGIFRANFRRKTKKKAKKKDSRKKKKIYWKDVRFRARKKTQKFIQHSSQGNCTCFELQGKHRLYRNARPVNLLFQLQFRAEHRNAINFFSLLGLLCCFAVYKARLFVIEGSKSKHCVFDRVTYD